MANRMGQSALFENESVQGAIADGAQLLNAIQSTGTASDDFIKMTGARSFNAITPERQVALQDMLEGMVSKNVWDNLSTNADWNNRLQQQMKENLSDIDPGEAYDFFKAVYDGEGYANLDGVMSWDEFSKNWFNKEAGK